MLRTALILPLALSALLTTPLAAPGPATQDVLSAMRKATDFMMNQVSHRGGFLWHYSADLKQKWGETPARDSQIWVQPPSTPTVGAMLLDVWRFTGDPVYLEYARQVAGALIWGQHPSGGWHYFIDFDPAGVQKWYDEVASQCRAWEEFYHYYGNATFDDDTTASPIRFLMELYLATLDPAYQEPLERGLGFVLASQFSNGAWPQRFPLRDDYQFEGRPDYTSFYSFNDDVISNNIYLLLEAYEKLGREEYLRAARRGMDFYILSQLAAPQAGWALQYDPELRPAWARSYEPASVCLDQTLENIKDLQNFYLITGDRRYLEPIPRALGWIESSATSWGEGLKFTHANFYEVGTNRPLAVHHDHRPRSDGRQEIGRYWADYDFGAELHTRFHPEGRAEQATGYHLAVEYQDSHYKSFELRTLDTAQLRAEYERIRQTPVEVGPEGYRKGIRRPYRFSDRRAEARADADEAARLIDSLDGRGAWLTTIEFLDTLDFTHNSPTTFQGVDTGTYVSNMYRLLNFLKEHP